MIIKCTSPSGKKVEAMQLTWSTWTEMCDFARVGDGPLDPHGISSGTNAIQMVFPSIIDPMTEKSVVARQNDFVLKYDDGTFSVCDWQTFEDKFEPELSAEIVLMPRANEAKFRETIWFENVAGAVWVPGHFDDERPIGFDYMHSQIPNQVTHTIHYLGETDAAVISESNTTYATDLVLAMVRPTVGERVRQLLRYGWIIESLSFDEAVLIAANMCSRCVNAQCHRRGLKDGYRRGSKQWHESNTRCSRCNDDE